METSARNRLVEKYNLPVPRYTSYPTVPVWKEGLDAGQWRRQFREQFQLHNQGEGISLYLHLPFCESLCTYCGCNKKITTNHRVEYEYLDILLAEFEMYLALVDETPIIRELHLGGGTPTFFSPANLARLIGILKDRSIFHPQHEFSFEGHPNNTTREHLQVLYDLGFRRVSYGVQDNDPEVQRVIHRVQPLENVRRATADAREIGYASVNFDMIYGLPKQTLESISRTFRQILELKPDRVAFYSYAHVPWTNRGQRLFDENDLPAPELKLRLYLEGKDILTRAGYTDIGMDHFALENDALYMAWKNGTLHRNFMGYTTQHTSLLLGMGVSSISDIGVAFAQNKKTLHDYYESIRRRELPVFRGYFLNEEDRSFRRYILDISCKGLTQFRKADLETLRAYTFPVLESLEADGLIRWSEDCLTVTPEGRHFIRNICSAFDLFIRRNKGTGAQTVFSKAI
jgi:oxygen-independent coproporphyrinogen-3 oxidase